MASPPSSQPMKKLRAGSTPISRQPRAGKTDVGIEADDAIARRRAELRRLAEQRNKKAAEAATRGRPDPASTAPTNTRPPVSTATDLMKPSADLSKTTRSRSTGRAPPPPPVARKLEFNKSGSIAPAPSSGNNRAKSVPPRRPPAPPRAGSTQRGGASETTTTAKQPPPRRPAPVDPATLIAAEPKPTQQPLLKKDAPPVEEPSLVDETRSKPPLVAKTPAASAKIPVEETPAPSAKIPVEATPAATIPSSEPPSTSRRDRMKQLREGLESPKTTTKPIKEEDSIPPLASAASARLEEELKKTEVERNEAFQKIKELEDKLTNMTKTTILQQQKHTPVNDMASLQEIMELFKSEGEEAAMKYAQDKLNKQPKPQQTGFLTPIASTPTKASKVAQRVATPHPNRGVAKGKVQPSDEDLERRFINTFREAVNFVPHEYYGATSVNGQSCIFFVRRPYGFPEQNDIFECVSPNIFDVYSKKAHVGDPTTIEVAVGIPFDDSVLCLVGRMGVRYRITPTGSFESKSNVQEPLGSISYIDESANEQEYSLDQILAEALSVREQYCASMMTTALGFERRRPQQPIPEFGDSSVAKPETAEVGVDTSDIPIPMEIALGEEKKDDKKEKTDKKEKKSKEESKEESKGKPSDPEELAGAGDVLISFIGIVFKSIFGFIFWIFIGLPIATIRASITMILASAIVGMLYLYALQYHHEALLGGGDSFYYSSTSSYHTNIAPGIL